MTGRLPRAAYLDYLGGLIDGAAERRLGADFAAAPRWATVEVGFWDMGMAA